MSDIRRTKQVTETKEVIFGYKCDGCGKEVQGQDIPRDWMHFSSHHEEWSEDSHESYEYHDVCSPNCLIAVVSKMLDELKQYKRSAEIAGMPYDFAQKLVQEFSNP